MQATIPAKRSLAQPEQAFTKTMPGKLALAITASAFVAFCAHISLPLPFTPVPLTLQNFAVLVVGVLLGPGAAFSAMMLYLAEGAIGLPVFSPTGLGGVAQLLGPTGGYLLSYPLAAAVAGLARNIRSRSFTRFTAGLLSTTAATLIILSFGAVWLGHMLHLIRRSYEDRRCRWNLQFDSPLAACLSSIVLPALFASPHLLTAPFTPAANSTLLS
jgi:biotin transport system substrate-specific component